MEHYYSDSSSKTFSRVELLWYAFIGCTLGSAYLGKTNEVEFALAFGIFAFVALIAAVVFTVVEHERN
jgi:hypothetical protein